MKLFIAFTWGFYIDSPNDVAVELIIGKKYLSV